MIKPPPSKNKLKEKEFIFVGHQHFESLNLKYCNYRECSSLSFFLDFKLLTYLSFIVKAYSPKSNVFNASGSSLIKH